MSTDLRAMLAKLVEDPPPVEIDLDRQIVEGRRRARRRTLAGSIAGVATVGLVAGFVATMAFQPANNTPEPAGQPSATQQTEPGKVSSGKFKVVSTAKSQALAAQLAQLAPETAQVPGAELNDAEDLKADGTPAGHLWAAALWTYPAGTATNSVHLTVEVANRGERVPRVCDGMTAPTAQRCSAVQALADGSTAYILDSGAEGGRQYGVRIVRPDGTQVFVSAGAQMPQGSTHDSVLDRARVVEIAQQITVTP